LQRVYKKYAFLCSTDMDRDRETDKDSDTNWDTTQKRDGDTDIFKYQKMRPQSEVYTEPSDFNV
jgi:hypothetical protein